MKTVRLSFDNFENGIVTTMQVDHSACPDIARWYGGYHDGDSYQVTIDGKVVPHDRNGELA